MDGSQKNEKAGEAKGDTRIGDSGQSVGRVSPWVSGNLIQIPDTGYASTPKWLGKAGKQQGAYTLKVCTGSESKWMILQKKIPRTAGKQTWFWKPELQVAGTWGTLHARLFSHHAPSIYLCLLSGNGHWARWASSDFVQQQTDPNSHVIFAKKC